MVTLYNMEPKLLSGQQAQDYFSRLTGAPIPAMTEGTNVINPGQPKSNTAATDKSGEPLIRNPITGGLEENPAYSRQSTYSSTPSDTQYSTAQGIVDAPIDTRTREQIQSDEKARLLKEQENRLSAIDKQFDLEVGSERNKLAGDLSRSRSINVLSGLMGAPDVAAQGEQIKGASRDVEASINARRQLAIQSVYDKVDDSAREYAKAQFETNQQKAKDLIASAATKAQNALMGFATTTGLTWDKLVDAHKDDQSFKDLIARSGMSVQEIASKYNAALDAKNKVDYQTGATTKDPLTGNAVIFQYGQNSKGEMSTRKIDTGVPYDDYLSKKYEHVEAKDGSLWNFDPSTGKATRMTGAISADGTSTAVQSQKAFDQIALMKNALVKAQSLASASGRSGARRAIEGVAYGATDFTELAGAIDTLKTNVMSMMTDPNIKKFFGPQMSDADVRLMTSAGTTLDPERQGPESLKAELLRLEGLINRAENAVRKGLGQKEIPLSGSTTVLIGPDENQYNVPNENVSAFINAGGRKP